MCYAGPFFVTNLVVRLHNLVGRDWRTAPLFIGATFAHIDLTAPTYRTIFALLLSVEPRFAEVCTRTAGPGSKVSVIDMVEGNPQTDVLGRGRSR